MTRVIVLAGVVVLAALSLLAPSQPGYDPWAWLLWGRELAGLRLDTVDGPAFKPLPVAVAALLAPAGDAAPALWLLVARAGAIAAVLLAARLAWRLAGGSWLAAAVAGAGVALTAGWWWHAAVGNAEGLFVALALGALDRALDGRHRVALGLALAAALIRPEAWPFLGAYGLWLWRAPAGPAPGARRGGGRAARAVVLARPLGLGRSAALAGARARPEPRRAGHGAASGARVAARGGRAAARAGRAGRTRHGSRCGDRAAPRPAGQARRPACGARVPRAPRRDDATVGRRGAARGRRPGLARARRADGGGRLVGRAALRAAGRRRAGGERRRGSGAGGAVGAGRGRAGGRRAGDSRAPSSPCARATSAASCAAPATRPSSTGRWARRCSAPAVVTPCSPAAAP